MKMPKKVFRGLLVSGNGIGAKKQKKRSNFMIFPKWKLKAVVQKTISYLPMRAKINYLFQKYITKGVLLTDEYFKNKIQHAKEHIEYFKKHTQLGQNKEILELGTGWYPIIPIAMYLTNCGKTTSVDIQNWITKKSLIITISKFIEWNNNGKLNKYFNNIDDKKWCKLENILRKPDNYSVEDINGIIGLKIMVCDARDTRLSEKSIDIICSNYTFEHIKKEVLIEILKEFKRIIKPGGVMSHFIDLTDHFAYFDKNISVYNFLKYSNKKWNRIDNRIQPQNRLRFVDYTNMYKELCIPYTEEQVNNKNVNDLQNIKVHKEFNCYSKKDLSITHGYIISHIK